MTLRTYCKAANIPRDIDAKTVGLFLRELAKTFEHVEKEGKGTLKDWDVNVHKEPVDEQTYLIITISARREEDD